MTSSFPTDSPTRTGESGSNRRKGRRSTREKIEKLVAEGAKNYPAYLKLIYTGDSEQSSEEENTCDPKTDALLPVIECETTGSGAQTNGAVKGGANSTVKRDFVQSPESAKLLDPGKEKSVTPTEGGPHDGSDDNNGTESTEDLCSTENANEAEQSSEPENVDKERNVEEKWKVELFQLQDDIISLKTMLNGKLQVAAELKQKLGMTPMSEFKRGFRSLRGAGTLLRSLSAFASRKMGTIRNSTVFKSVEERVDRMKSRSMGQIKTTLHRSLPGSLSDSNVSDMKSADLESIDSQEEDASQNSFSDSANSSHDY